MTRYPRLAIILLAAPLLAGVALPVGDVGRDLAPVVHGQISGLAESAKNDFYSVTAYGPGCGASGLTAAGTWPTLGTVSAPPAIPFGTRVAMDGYTGVVLDRGGAIWGNRLDVFLESCWAARQWGRRWLWVEFDPPPATSSNATTDAAPNEEASQESDDGND